jgi:hypothetical protein
VLSNHVNLSCTPTLPLRSCTLAFDRHDSPSSRSQAGPHDATVSVVAQCGPPFSTPIFETVVSHARHSCTSRISATSPAFIVAGPCVGLLPSVIVDSRGKVITLHLRDVADYVRLIVVSRREQNSAVGSQSGRGLHCTIRGANGPEANGVMCNLCRSSSSISLHPTSSRQALRETQMPENHLLPPMFGLKSCG